MTLFRATRAISSHGHHRQCRPMLQPPRVQELFRTRAYLLRPDNVQAASRNGSKSTLIDPQNSVVQRRVKSCDSKRSALQKKAFARKQVVEVQWSQVRQLEFTPTPSLDSPSTGTVKPTPKSGNLWQTRKSMFGKRSHADLESRDVSGCYASSRTQRCSAR